MGKAVIAIHGGAGAISRAQMSLQQELRYIEALSAIVETGQKMLEAGESALDVVTEAVRLLEECPLFNAGIGAVFTRDETHELDACVMARFTRASFVDVLSEDYMRTARAKGVSETWVVLKHGLRNAMIPVVTMMGLQFGFLLGGSIVVEKVFNWPGLGRLLVDSVEMRDYPVIQAEILLFSLEFILINLVVDVLYAAINPAIRYK
ncbi:ABC transporter permease subunit [Escherichia coli]|nr:ABC transporter permease subunit [Escherichia coli]